MSMIIIEKLGKIQKSAIIQQETQFSEQQSFVQ